MKINADAIRQLAELLNETGLNEIEVADGDMMIRVNKGATVMANYPSMVASPAGFMPSDPTTPQPLPQASDKGANAAGAVTSPMVGTAYLSPEPGAAPFVSVGQTVKAGDVLLIIEAMKVMNQIRADKGGVIRRIAVDNGQPVEFGDVLMIFE